VDLINVLLLKNIKSLKLEEIKTTTDEIKNKKNYMCNARSSVAAKAASLIASEYVGCA
jgi:hypothetical protein